MINTLKYSAELCVGCGMCEMVCPHGIFILESGKARMLNSFDCIECGACSLNCPTGAITVESGVGCAAAMINSVFSKKNNSSCCSCDSDSTKCC